MIKKLLISLTVVLLMASPAFAPKVGKPLLGRPINPAHPLSEGLVGCWPTNERTGNKIYDLSRNGRIGSFGAGTARPVWIGGIHGPALKFDGTHDEITTPSFDMGSTLTVVFWVRLDALLASGEWGDVICKRTGVANDFWFLFDLDERVRFYVHAGGEGNYAHSTTVFQVGRWYQVAGVVNSSGNHIYVNGKYEDSASTPEAPDGGTSPVAFGQGYGASRFFNGAICHAILFDWDLSAGEIDRLYREPFCMFKPSFAANLMYVAPAPSAAGQVIIVNMN